MDVLVSLVLVSFRSVAAGLVVLAGVAGPGTAAIAETDTGPSGSADVAEAATDTTLAGQAGPDSLPVFFTDFLASDCAATVEAELLITLAADPYELVDRVFADVEYEPIAGSEAHFALGVMGVGSAQELRGLGRTVAEERLYAWVVRRSLRRADPDEPSCEEQWIAVEAVLPGRGRAMDRPGRVHNVAVSDGWLVTWDGPTLGQMRDFYEAEVLFGAQIYVLETEGLGVDIAAHVEDHPMAEFTVRVRACQEVFLSDPDCGDWTEMLGFVPPGLALPGKPTDLSLAPVGERWMLNWVPSEDGGPVETYYVVLGTQQMPVPTTAPTFDVTDPLRSGGSPVIAKVRAWNQAGYSDWSDELTVTNPLTTSTPTTTARVPTPDNVSAAADEEGGFGPLVAVPIGVAVGVLVWWLVSRTQRPNADTGRSNDRKGPGPAA